MKQLIIWLLLVAIYAAWWWVHLTSFFLWQLWNGYSNPLLFVILVWAMWWCHENLGWFGGRPSESDAPRMHYHPTDDRP